MPMLWALKEILLLSLKNLYNFLFLHFLNSLTQVSPQEKLLILGHCQLTF